MAEGYVTTHVLDAGRGCPAAGMRIELFRIEGEARRLVRAVVTNADGRTDAPVIPKGELEAGVWELVFHAGAYLDARRVAGGEPAVPRPDPDPLRDRGSGGALPRAAAAGALQLLDVSGELRAGGVRKGSHTHNSPNS